MNIAVISDKANLYFRLALASNNLYEFALNVKQKGSDQYNGLKFSFFDSDMVNDKPGEYIVSYSPLKDGAVIIQYNLLNKELVLIHGSKGIVSNVQNASFANVDQYINNLNKLKELDEISVSYNNPSKDMKLDDLYNSFRTNDTDLLEIVESSLGISIPHGEMLGAGAEGEVYDYGHGKIIKFFLLPDKKKDSVLSFLKKLEAIKSKYVTKIYNSGIAARVGQKLLVGEISSFENPIWIAYYIADKVFPIKGEKDPNKVEILKKELNKLGFDPWDFEENPDNIMQDIEGNYLYVDFGGVADFF